MGAKSDLEEKLNTIRERWVKASRSKKFTLREIKLFERMLKQSGTATIAELFDIAHRYGMNGAKNLQENLKRGYLTVEEVKEIKRNQAARYLPDRAKQMYLGPIHRKLNAKLSSQGVGVKIRPGNVKRTYVLSDT